MCLARLTPHVPLKTLSTSQLGDKVASFMNNLLCSPAALARRAQVVETIQPFRRTRPRVPFWHLAAHRIPTLWTLYRGLRKAAPTENISWRVGQLWKHDQHLTGLIGTRKQLLRWHQWLDAFRAAQAGDAHWGAVLSRYNRIIATKVDKVEWKRIIRDAVAWKFRLQSRPIVTGGLMKPTIYHGPLPRMRRQPTKLSVMIHQRRQSRARRAERAQEISELRRDVNAESRFEHSLGRDVRESVWKGPAASEWLDILKEENDVLNAQFSADARRANTPFPPALLKQIVGARRAKIRNKTVELQRERCGVMTTRALRRKRKSMPAHILATSSEKARRYDRIVRSVSEVGYVGMVKERVGHGPQKGKWRLYEEGLKWNRRRLGSTAERIQKVNEQRRAKAESREG